MQFTLKEYKGYPYIEYFDEVKGYIFTNKEYFIFDTICNEFKAIMRGTGGFTANVTTRFIEEKNLPCESMMLCHSPSNDNSFYFQFVYLDKDRNVLHVEWDNNYGDYKYFKEKFATCIIEEGCIFDLLKYDHFKEVTKEFKTPTVNFNLQVDGKEFELEDVLICRDISLILKEELIEKWAKYNIAYAELRYNWDQLNSSHFLVRFVKEDGSYLPSYQVKFGYDNLEQFRKLYVPKEQKYYEDDINFYCEPFETMAFLPFLKSISDHLERKELEEVEEKEI